MIKATKAGITRRRLMQVGLLAAGSAVSASVLPSKAPAQGGKGGSMAVWAGASYNATADEAIGNVFKEWGRQNGVNVDYQVIAGTGTEYKNRYTAAIEAKQPPEIAYMFEADTQYYRAQDQLQDLTDVVNGIKNLEGGIFESALITMGFQGKYYGIPFVVNPWVMHVREDILKQAGVPYPQTWADVINISSKVSKPPQVYMLGQCLGRDYDSSNHFIPQMWCFGGTMQNNQGALVFKGPGTLEAIKWVKEAYSKQVIPPGATTWDSTGNNKAYQSRQCVITYNPNSIYAYLEANDKDLTSKTGMYNAPGGPKGAFDGIDIRGFASFKGCKNPTAAREALSYFIQPKNYEKIIETGLNRWAPIYKNMMDRPLWDKPAYKNYKKIMTNGRFVAFSGPPNSAIGEVMDQFIISDMLVDVVSNNKDPEKAMNEAYDKMVAIYKKWKQPIA